MSKIRSVTKGGNETVAVSHQTHTFNYVRPVNTSSRQGRTLTIETDDSTVVLGGAQINAVKKILATVGEI